MANRSLLRRDPFYQDLWDFRQGFDDLFNQFLTHIGQSRSRYAQGLAWAPQLETYTDGGKYHVRVDLAGVDPKDVQIEVHGNQLSISGERKSEKEVSEDKYLHREFSYGSFQRVISLPQEVEADQVEANFNNGLLELTAPISQKALPRKVEIKGISAQTQPRQVGQGASAGEKDTSKKSAA